MAIGARPFLISTRPPNRRSSWHVETSQTQTYGDMSVEAHCPVAPSVFALSVQTSTAASSVAPKDFLSFGLAQILDHGTSR